MAKKIVPDFSLRSIHFYRHIADFQGGCCAVCTISSNNISPVIIPGDYSLTVRSLKDTQERFVKGVICWCLLRCHSHMMNCFSSIDAILIQKEIDYVSTNL